MESKTLTVEIKVLDEFTNGPEVGVAEVTPKLAARIRELSSGARALGAYKVAEFEYSLNLYVRDWEREDKAIIPAADMSEEEKNACRSDCTTLNVNKEKFYWRGYIKNTGIAWESSPTPLSYLDDIEKPEVKSTGYATALAALRRIEASILTGSIAEKDIREVALKDIRSILEAPNPVVGVVVEGGLVQSIVSDQPDEFIAPDFVVIDYDTAEADDSEVIPVSSLDGTTKESIARIEVVERASIDLQKLKSNILNQPLPGCDPR